MAPAEPKKKYPNKNGLVRAEGRPREHDRKQIAIDMIEWAKKPDSINFNKFCAYYEPIIPPSNILFWCKEDPEFLAAYESAKLFLGFRREEMLNNESLHVKAYDLNATVYDKFLRDERRNQLEFEANLSKQTAEAVNDKIIDSYNQFHEQLKSLRKSQVDGSMSMLPDSLNNAPSK